MASDHNEFYVGQQFSSYEELKSSIDIFSKTTFTQLWKRDARKISAVKKILLKKLEPSLIYYELKYACIFGGRSFKQKSTATGKRQSSTFRQDCPMQITLRASVSGKSLEVKSVCFSHNHEVSKESYAHLPHQRKLDDSSLERAKTLLDLQANKKLVQQALQKETQQVIILKDLSNIAASNSKGTDNLLASVGHLKDKYNADVEILKDNDNNFRGLLFQTQTMKRTLDAFPEFLAMDATYKLLRLNFPVYLMMIEDGNCQSEIVAVSILVCENTSSIQWFVQTFKKNNPSTSKIRCIMTDKDLTERQVLKDNFPNASIILCVFHTMRTLNREISTEKLGISQNQRLVALEFLQKMVYAKNEEDFDKLYQDFSRVVPKSVVEYYEKNWHESRDEWSLGKKFHTANFLNNTNNRLESINGKLKSVINKHSTLEAFIEQLFVIISAMENERDHKAVVAIQKRPVNHYRKGSLEDQYYQLLTRGATGYVIKQIEMSKSMKIGTENIDNTYTIISSEGTVEASVQSCTCNFSSSMLLPCKHIFAIREQRGITGFDANLCNDRWKLDYYKKNQRILRPCMNADETEVGEQSPNVSFSIIRKTKPKSVAEKRRAALSVANALADLAALKSNMMFDRRIEQLKVMKTYWEAGIEVTVAAIKSAEYADDVDLPLSDEDRNTFDLLLPVTNVTERLPNNNEKDFGTPLEDPATDIANNNDVYIHNSNFPENGLVVISVPDDDHRLIPINSTEQPDDNGTLPSSEQDKDRIDYVLPITDVIGGVPNNNEKDFNTRLENRKTDSVNNNNVDIQNSNLAENGLTVVSVPHDDNKSTSINWKEQTDNLVNPFLLQQNKNRIDLVLPVTEGTKGLLHESQIDLDTQSAEPETDIIIKNGADSQSSNPPKQKPVIISVLHDAELQGIKMPAVLKRRGRPKGHGQTTIGLPKKKSDSKNGVTRKPTSFVKLPYKEKQINIIKMITTHEGIIKKAMNSEIIDVGDINIQVNEMSNCILDECVDVGIVCQYFTADAWQVVQKFIKKKSKNVIWLCHSCNKSLIDESIGCDSCLKWYHLKCVSLSKKPKARNWFCRQCYKSYDD